jgi:hypothetical protein
MKFRKVFSCEVVEVPNLSSFQFLCCSWPGFAFDALLLCSFHVVGMTLNVAKSHLCLAFLSVPNILNTQPTPRSAALRRGALISTLNENGDDDENAANNTIVLHEVTHI